MGMQNVMRATDDVRKCFGVGAKRGNASVLFGGHEQDWVSGFGWKHEVDDTFEVVKSNETTDSTKAETDVLPVVVDVEQSPMSISPLPHDSDVVVDLASPASSIETLMAKV